MSSYREHQVPDEVTQKVLTLVQKIRGRLTDKVATEDLNTLIKYAKYFLQADSNGLHLMEHLKDNSVMTGLICDTVLWVHGEYPHRELSPVTWEMVAEAGGEYLCTSNTMAKAKSVLKAQCDSPSSFITLWVNKEDGINDMLCTLYVLAKHLN